MPLCHKYMVPLLTVGSCIPDEQSIPQAQYAQMPTVPHHYVSPHRGGC